MTDHRTVILLRCGEIMLKGLNKTTFVNTLATNIKRTLNGLGPIAVTRAQSRVFVEPFEDGYDFEEAVSRLSKVPGLVSSSIVWKIEAEMGAIRDAAVELTGAFLSRDPRRTFKVVTKRGDKHFPLDSIEIDADLGALLLERFPELKVDVKKPGFTLHVEVRDSAYVYTDIVSGVGGLPTGTGGKALLLLSGGIDSPVAGWMVAKRGVALSAVHFYSPPYTSERSLRKVVELAKVLTRSTMALDLYIVPFADVQVEIYRNAPEDMATIVMKRAMTRIASMLARRIHAQALVTGESIGQVASQTMQGIAATDDAARMLVFRPLVAMDKNEVVEIARRIGTYDISIQPFDDCCTLFVPKHPQTRPRIEVARRIEEGMDIAEPVRTALRGITRISLRYDGGEIVEERQDRK